MIPKTTKQSSIICYTESSSKGDNNDVDDFDFMASLRDRVEEVNVRATTMPLVVLDSMLPRQVIKIQIENPMLIELVGECLTRENPYFGMLGMARLITGAQVHLKAGVEVEIVASEKVNDKGGIRLILKARRRFVIDGDVGNSGKGWTEAKVKFLDSEKEETEEIERNKNGDGTDRMSVARAIVRCNEFTCPNANMKNNTSLKDRWIELAKENEKEPGQIDELLNDLGEMPPAEEPTERALWIGALINPLPSMGVALEVRPQLLTAKTAESRVQIALDGILKSIKHMDGSARLF